jgi:HAD superfamily hydrolase (TIGR01509 family)
MTIDALIFDLDGTLADTEETHRQAFNYAFVRFGLHWEWSKPRYRELLHTSGGKERLIQFIATLPAPAGEKARLHRLVPAIHATKAELYTELIADGRCPLRPGVRRLIDEAHKGGVGLAIASTTSSANVHTLLARHLGGGASRWFRTIVSGDLVAHKKPAPDIYRLVLSTLGVPAESCVAFEDSVNGLRATKAAGLFTVVTPSQWTSGDDFDDADLELSCLGDPDHLLSGAEAAATGAPWLGLAELQHLHAAAMGRAASDEVRS